MARIPLLIEHRSLDCQVYQFDRTSASGSARRECRYASPVPSLGRRISMAFAGRPPPMVLIRSPTGTRSRGMTVQRGSLPEQTRLSQTRRTTSRPAAAAASNEPTTAPIPRSQPTTLWPVPHGAVDQQNAQTENSQAPLERNSRSAPSSDVGGLLTARVSGGERQAEGQPHWGAQNEPRKARQYAGAERVAETPRLHQDDQAARRACVQNACNHSAENDSQGRPQATVRSLYQCENDNRPRCSRCGQNFWPPRAFPNHLNSIFKPHDRRHRGACRPKHHRAKRDGYRCGKTGPSERDLGGAQIHDRYTCDAPCVFRPSTQKRHNHRPTKRLPPNCWTAS